MNWLLSKQKLKIFITAYFGLVGGCAMSADIELNWEWPDDRKADQKVLVQIVEIKEKSRGFFGLKRSPSFVDNLPDPVTVKAVVVNKTAALDSRTLELTLPRVELDGISATNYAIVGIVDSKTCICIKKVDSESTDVSTVNCP